jgi:hypothetical protein
MRSFTALITAAVLLAGCGSAQVGPQQLDASPSRLPKPDRVLVHDSAFAPDQVAVDSGLGRDLVAARDGSPRTAEELALGRRVADELADDLVAELRRRGLPAEQAGGAEWAGGADPTAGTVLLALLAADLAAGGGRLIGVPMRP